MIRAALLALWLATPAAGQTPVGDWQLTRQHSASPGAGQCAVSVKDEAGAALSLWMRDAARRKSGFRLTLTLAPGLRDLLPMPDGEVALAFRPTAAPAVLLEGTLVPDGPLYTFTHVFPDMDAQRSFLEAAGAGRVTVFHPEAGVIARFATEGGARAMHRLTSCEFSIEAPKE